MPAEKKLYLKTQKLPAIDVPQNLTSKFIDTVIETEPET